MHGIGSKMGINFPVFLIPCQVSTRIGRGLLLGGACLLSWIVFCEPYVFGGRRWVQWGLRKGHGRVTPELFINLQCLLQLVRAAHISHG